MAGMTTFVALLRGVNVGRAKRVPMATLRDLLAGLGYADVRTLLNSGNAVFRAAGASTTAHADAIRAAIEQALSLTVPVIVKSASELAAIVDGNPFADEVTDPSRLLVVFTPDERALAGLRPLASQVTAPEAFHIGRHAAYLHCPNGILQSRAGEAALGRSVASATTRNWATTLKLDALARGGDPRAR